MAGPASWRGRLAAWLESRLVPRWYRARLTGLTTLLAPVGWLYGALFRLRRAATRLQRPDRLPVPVIVVGNLVAGGAGKTPVVIAIVQALQAAGRCVGVVSRGHGRCGTGVLPVLARRTSPHEAGDEPLLIARRTGVPVWVGADRVMAARALLAAHPQVDVLVSDDGLQHHRLVRDIEVLVFDGRGIGNGQLLPAGPLREPFHPSERPHALVLYNHPVPSTAWPGRCASAQLRQAVPLAAWQAGSTEGQLPIEALRSRRCLAMAGIAEPDRFFSMLEQAGLHIDRLPLPDHHNHATPAWPAGVADILTTEKDAVKLGPAVEGLPRIWVLPLDFNLPDETIAELLRRLPPHPLP